MIKCKQTLDDFKHVSDWPAQTFSFTISKSTKTQEHLQHFKRDLNYMTSAIRLLIKQRIKASVVQGGTAENPRQETSYIMLCFLFQAASVLVQRKQSICSGNSFTAVPCTTSLGFQSVKSNPALSLNTCFCRRFEFINLIFTELQRVANPDRVNRATMQEKV